MIPRFSKDLFPFSSYVDEPLLASPDETIKSLFLKNPWSLSLFLCVVNVVFFDFFCGFIRWISDFLLASYKASSSRVGSPDSDPSAAPEDSVVSGAVVGESLGRGEMIKAAISMRLMSAVLSFHCCHSGCSLAGMRGGQVKR